MARAAAAEALAAAGDGTDAIYLTVDMDAINPGEAPGTGWPEPGGLTGQQAIAFVRALAPHIAAMVSPSSTRSTTLPHAPPRS